MSNCNNSNTGKNSCNFTNNCFANDGLCSDLGLCYDFIIKRHDALPEFKLEVTDCDDPINMTDLIAEASMWINSKLKSDITIEQTTIKLADNIGFDSILENTIIQAGIGRNFERMKVIGFNEVNKEIYVERGYKSTTPFPWKKGTNLKLLRFLSSPAITEMTFEDVTNIDGSTLKNQLTHSYLIYKWRPEDTCLAGCFYFEFKLLKMFDMGSPIPNVSYSPCDWGHGVEWVRRFPNDKDGFLIQIYNSPTGE
jgi:hypothetical protein